MTLRFFLIFFFNDTATTEIYTLSLHDALPILIASPKEEEDYLMGIQDIIGRVPMFGGSAADDTVDRKSTRLNSSHVAISYAVFCLKKKINT